MSGLPEAGRRFALFPSLLGLAIFAFALSVTGILVSEMVEYKADRCFLKVRTPSALGFCPVFRSEGNGYVYIPLLEAETTPDGDFCSQYDCGKLNQADLRILLPQIGDVPSTVQVTAQLVSGDGSATLDLPPIRILTYSAHQFGQEVISDPHAVERLPRLALEKVTFSPPASMTRILCWFLAGLCAAVGILSYLSISRGSGAAWAGRMAAVHHPAIEMARRHPFLMIVLLNTGLFIGTALCFAQRYPFSDDPMMAMIANGMLGQQPSEYVVFMNVIVGLGLKGLSILAPSIAWHACFSATVLILSSSVIGLLMVKCWGFWRGGLFYGATFAIFIFEYFFQIEFTTTATLACLAGLSLLLVAERNGQSLFSLVSVAALLLIWAGSLIRYDSAFMVIVLAAPALAFQGLLRGRYSWGLFLLLGFLGMIALRGFNDFYYDRSPDWKFYRMYNAERGQLHQTPKFQSFSDNEAVYRTIGWSENDAQIMSEDWLYQDLEVFSLDKLAYLNTHLVSPLRWGPAGTLLLIRSVTYLWMSFALMALLTYNMLTQKHHPLMGFIILGSVFGSLYYLAWSARIPEHVFCSVMLTGFLLATFLTTEGNPQRKHPVCACYFISVGLFVVAAGLMATLEKSGRDARRTVELEKSIDHLAFLRDKIFLVSISSLPYEDLPPFENDSRLKSIHFIDGLWTYPSPDVLRTCRQFGIDHPLTDLARNKDYFLLIPTIQWRRADDLLTFLHEHGQPSASYEVVTDPSGHRCCYPNFTVLKFRSSTSGQ